MKPTLALLFFLGAALLLGGCGNLPERSYPEAAAFEPRDYPPQPAAAPNGAIYQAGHNLSLFEDMRARQAGDIVTVILAEATDAAKSSDTSLDKTNTNTITNPVLAGLPRTIGSESNLGFDLSSDSAFEGESESNQRNRLQGSIAVTVTDVLPGGNLYIQGEKWIHINQGNEYIRLQGVVRPVDISTTNTILSTKVADARISYGGTGAPAQVNMAGWLTRFFLSPLWPF